MYLPVFPSFLEILNFFDGDRTKLKLDFLLLFLKQYMLLKTSVEPKFQLHLKNFSPLISCTDLFFENAFALYLSEFCKCLGSEKTKMIKIKFFFSKLHFLELKLLQVLGREREQNQG